MNERLGTDIDDRTEKTEIHETMNNVDNYSDYNEICTKQTPTLETSTTNKDTPKQLDKPITDKDETAIATTTKTKEENKTTTNEIRTSRPRRTKTISRHFQNYTL